MGDNSDVFFENPYEWQDTDGDGVGTTRIYSHSDQMSGRTPMAMGTERMRCFPDLGEWNDTDGDGVGDNTDYYPLMEKGGNGNGLWERLQ